MRRACEHAALDTPFGVPSLVTTSSLEHLGHHLENPGNCLPGACVSWLLQREPKMPFERDVVTSEGVPRGVPPYATSAKRSDTIYLPFIYDTIYLESLTSIKWS